MRFQTYVQMQMALSDNRSAPGSRTADSDPMLCEYTLRKVLSFLELPELLTSAALVSKRWDQASRCKEVWRRRMHKQVLDLFRNGPLPGQMTPARLFHCLYSRNLLSNSAFLERDNTIKTGQPDEPRRHAWEATHNLRGMTWAHPFDFLPELSQLPVGGSKPFSVGCIATGPCHHNGWSEMVQVVDLSAVLQGQGVPADLTSHLLAAGLPVELSVYVAGGAIAGGEYQVVLTLLSAADVAAAEEQQLPLAAVPKMTVPFGHPPAGTCHSVAAAAAANLKGLGLSSSRCLAKAPLHPPPGEWTRFSCRATLPQAKPVSRVVVALRGIATRNKRGHFATKYAAAHLGFVTADQS